MAQSAPLAPGDKVEVLATGMFDGCKGIIIELRGVTEAIVGFNGINNPQRLPVSHLKVIK